MTDRVFTIAFGVSLALHMLLFVSRFITSDWFRFARSRAPMDVIYEYKVAEHEVRRLQTQLAMARRRSAMASSPAELTEQIRVRVPDRPSLIESKAASQLRQARSTVVDLTNLADASRGDPVFLSYFSAIREQIQRTANERSWIMGQVPQGTVYVSFELQENGTIRGAQVIAERSVDSGELQDVAVRIVKSASPFPAFPPSMQEPSKTLVVPLEFLFGP